MMKTIKIRNSLILGLIALGELKVEGFRVVVHSILLIMSIDTNKYVQSGYMTMALKKFVVVYAD